MTNPVPYVVVVGTDYSKASGEALLQALEGALGRSAAELHVLHVVPANRAAIPAEMSQVPVIPEHELVKAAGNQLTEHVGEVLAASSKPWQQLRSVTSHLRQGEAATELAQFASDIHADIIVVGTHGRRDAQRWLLGSVAEKVVRLAPCPVLVVRPKQVSDVPEIEPPCPRCVQARADTARQQLWCDQHRIRHGSRHHYHYEDRVGANTNFPLVLPIP